MAERNGGADAAGDRPSAAGGGPNAVGAADILTARGLKKHFPIKRGILKRTVGWIRAVDDVSFHVRRGETLGLVGESGSGKTTVLRLLVRAVEPTGGHVVFRPGDGPPVDLVAADRETLKAVRRRIRVVFQDPESSLNPRMTVRRIIGEPLMVNDGLRGGPLDDAVKRLMRTVGLKPEQRSRYPYAFSGGQRQRIGVARALALDPQLLLADEPTSALDVSVQAQILNLLLDLQRDLHLTVLFVTHDLSVIRHMTDRVAVMYLGHFVEVGERQEIFRRPKHPYTEALFSGIPQPDPHRPLKRIILEGDIPDVAKAPAGCPFHTRCPYRQPICEQELPPLAPVAGDGQVSAGHLSAGHLSACHFAEELRLKGEDDLLGGA